MDANLKFLLAVVVVAFIYYNLGHENNQQKKQPLPATTSTTTTAATTTAPNDDIMFSLPDDIRQSDAEKKAADEKMTKGGKMGYRMGEPKMTFDRIDRRYANKLGIDLNEYALRRDLLTLREEHELTSGMSSKEARRVLKSALQKLPTEQEIARMVDPGGWQKQARLKRKWFKMLIRDTKLREQFIREADPLNVVKALAAATSGDGDYDL